MYRVCTGSIKLYDKNVMEFWQHSFK